jgi:hypothetical protein
MSTENVPKFTLNKKVHVIRIDLKTQYQLVDKFDFNILKLFLDEQLTRETMLKLLIDTEFAIELCWFFIEKKVDYNKETMLEYLDSAAGLDEFKEAVWAAIVNFSSPLIRKMLVEMWGQLKHELKTFNLDLETSTQSSSESSQEESKT